MDLDALFAKHADRVLTRWQDPPGGGARIPTWRYLRAPDGQCWAQKTV